MVHPLDVDGFRDLFGWLGLAWSDLKVRYPRLIYAAVSGFGHSGPHSQRPAYDMVVQAKGGIMSITGQEGGEPTRVGRKRIEDFWDSLS